MKNLCALFTYVMRAIVIAVRVQYDGQTWEMIFAAKDRTRLHAILCVPDGKPVTKQFIALAMYLEPNLYLPIAVQHGLFLERTIKIKIIF